MSEQLAAGYKKLDENRAKTKNEPWKQNLDKLERDIAELQEQEAEIDRQTAELRRKLVSVKTECEASQLCCIGHGLCMFTIFVAFLTSFQLAGEEEITMEEFVVQM